MPDLAANAQRFSGFAGLYDRVRPSPPPALAELTLDYGGISRAGTMVDLGCDVPAPPQISGRRRG